MPRRNLYLLVAIMVVSLVCYRRADSANRHRYGRMFDTFTSVLGQVRERYIEEVDDRELFEGAMNGMLSRLDPNSAFHGAAETAEVEAELEQKFGGIGIEVLLDQKTSLPLVATPIFGSPAYEKGIHAGDLIYKVDGEVMEGLTLEEATERMRGKEGEVVRLTILRRDVETPLNFEITRAQVPVDSVKGDLRNDDGSWNFLLGDGKERLGYIRVHSFGKQTVAELTAALEQLKQQQARGLILDLRNNAGGLLEAGIDTCDLFLSAGNIVSTRGRDQNEQRSWDATAESSDVDLPLVILINGNSASAAEIVAACLQDHRRAVVVGERSFGKGTVQDLIPLEEGKSELRLTVATYWRPSGQNIHRGRDAGEEDAWGVSPNPGFEVKLTDAELRTLFDRRRARDVIQPPGQTLNPAPTDAAPSEDPYQDRQLQKGIEALREQLSK